MGQILQTSNDDGIWSVRINRPEVRNVLSIDLMVELTDAARRLQDDPGVRAVILSANGANFTAGADLKDSRRWNLDKAGLAERRALPYVGERMCQAWEDIPAVTICAVEGYCIGGGTALAICTDFRVVGESAWFQLPEIALGLPLSWGAVPRLVRLLGPAKARRAIILCDKLAGPEAVEIGLADYLAADGKAYAQAQQLARRIADLPETSVKMSKEAINVTANAFNRLASFMARDQLALAVQSEEAVAARKKFAAKKKPRS
jgi:enoyl-CoA hydratase/carnithine racemase